MPTQSESWSTVAKVLHWLAAILIFVQLPIAEYAHELDPSPAKIDAFIWHKSIGMLVLLLAVIRISRRLFATSPPSLTDSRALQMMAHAGHGLLYVLMIAVPMAGWVASSASNIPFKFFWLFQVPSIAGASESLAEQAGEVHEALVGALLAMILLHVVAALWHHFKLKDATLRRMWIQK